VCVNVITSSSDDRTIRHAGSPSCPEERHHLTALSEFRRSRDRCRRTFVVVVCEYGSTFVGSRKRRRRHRRRALRRSGRLKRPQVTPGCTGRADVRWRVLSVQNRLRRFTCVMALSTRLPRWRNTPDPTLTGDSWIQRALQSSSPSALCVPRGPPRRRRRRARTSAKSRQFSWRLLLEQFVVAK
jgi:hypothetical protein